MDLDLAPVEDVHPPVCCDWLVNFTEWPWSRHPERQIILYDMYEETYREIFRRVRENQTGNFQHTLESCLNYVAAQHKKADQIANRAGPPIRAPPQHQQPRPQS